MSINNIFCPYVKATKIQVCLLELYNSNTTQQHPFSISVVTNGRGLSLYKGLSRS